VGLTAERDRPPTAGGRLDAVDVLRGLVMVVMTLDHVRDFLGPPGNPEDLTRASTALFLTRWVTHFCAPVFTFLAGTGAYLRGTRTPSRAALAGFLLTRGLWLVLLEFTVLYWTWSFSFDYRFTVGTVLWSIGGSMVLLSALVFLPAPAVGLLGVAIIAGHNLFDGVRGDDLGRWGWLWDVLHNRQAFEPFPGYRFFVAYPLLPWFGVAAAGYGFGTLLNDFPSRGRPRMLAIGTVLTLAFLALRAANAYGDPRPWSDQGDLVRTVLSFLNCNKYPPSLLFTLMTLGPAIAFLGVADLLPGWAVRFLTAFGRVPLFYFLLHLFVAHALAVALIQAHGLLNRLVGSTPLEENGYGLPAVYLAWVGVVLALWPVCRWYAGVKRRHPGGVLSYL
jgi:uncharacterized membrane protein